MINTHLRFQAKIPNGSKVVAFTRNYTKFSINSLSEKAKFHMGQFKSLKQIFSKFVDQFDLEGLGQGHQFLNLSDIFR